MHPHRRSCTCGEFKVFGFGFGEYVGFYRVLESLSGLGFDCFSVLGL